MKIHPTAEFVLLQQEEPETAGSITIPQQFRGQRARCRVLEVGPEVTRCKPDDYVIIARSGSYLPVDPDNESIWLMAQDDVVAVVEYEASDGARLIVTAGGAA